MALLKPDFIRSHPIQAGMVWAIGFAILFPLIMWVMGSPISLTKAESLGVFVGACILGGLAWGYGMKFIHDRWARQ